MHLAKTNNPPCIKVREDAEKSGLDDADSSEEFGDVAGLFPSGGGLFGGDLFGDNYTQDDFNYISSDDSETESDFEDEEDSDPIAAEYAAVADAQAADGWEAPRPAPDGPDEDIEMDDLPAPTVPRAARKIVEDRFHEEPEIVKYPSKRAGEIMSEERVASSEAKYGDALGQSSTVYAPFASKMSHSLGGCSRRIGVEQHIGFSSSE
ncbi:hypothetical protein B0H16DRAFT_1711237 [Mycena metata]|uniref:Uncharacterized protein n=1 Tax=Mycena metata TaxID=1033252 RepID=A0AAD7K7V5_9AGAR|nr:hypothetical protein B0H16DRAFT_1711237 [Mycena metata]